MASFLGQWKVTIRETGETHQVVFSLSEKEVAVLSEFLEEAGPLSEIPVIRAGLDSSLHIAWSKEDGVRIDLSLPPLADLAAVLHKLRPFILKKEPFSFDRTCGILGRRLESPFVRKLLKHEREIYSGKRMQSQVQLTSQDVVINSEATLMAWLNSHEYHRDREKAADLDRLHQIFPLEVSKALFVMLLRHKVDAILGLAEIVKLVLRKQESLTVRLGNGQTRKVETPAPRDTARE
jgi:hypothetical protein